VASGKNFMKSIAVLGSTGSIGLQTLEVIRKHPDKFSIIALASGGTNIKLLREQITEFCPKFVFVPTTNSTLNNSSVSRTTRIVGSVEELIEESKNAGAELILNAISGSVGLEATLYSLKSGLQLALANKESLVVGGDLVLSAKKFDDQIIAVDSEHSAISQCLLGNSIDEVKKIILTGSGGPFRTYSVDELGKVTPEQALKHPNWNMGKVITINSATMVNKGLEYIEAKYLFRKKEKDLKGNSNNPFTNCKDKILVKSEAGEVPATCAVTGNSSNKGIGKNISLETGGVIRSVLKSEPDIYYKFPIRFI
jgi:1-deoxy-D-xylulose-5-phosphate reductoisomerase